VSIGRPKKIEIPPGGTSSRALDSHGRSAHEGRGRYQARAKELKKVGFEGDARGRGVSFWSRFIANGTAADRAAVSLAVAIFVPFWGASAVRLATWERRRARWRTTAA